MLPNAAFATDECKLFKSCFDKENKMVVIKSSGLRAALRIIIPFVAIPALVLMGVYVFEDKMYAYISLVITILSIVLFISGFEQRKIGTRRMVLVVVLTVLSVIGRFFPIIKPVTAITIIAGIYLGGEAGFLVGAISAVISNFFWGQGPWTPFQMFAWGLIGLIAGLAAKPLRKNRLLLLIYGALSGALFSFIMDIWTVLWYNNGFDVSLYLTAISTAVPMTLVYAASNVIFLLFLAGPIGKKLERIKTVYGI